MIIIIAIISTISSLKVWEIIIIISSSKVIIKPVIVLTKIRNI